MTTQPPSPSRASHPHRTPSTFSVEDADAKCDSHANAATPTGGDESSKGDDNYNAESDEKFQDDIIGNVCRNENESGGNDNLDNNQIDDVGVKTSLKSATSEAEAGSVEAEQRMNHSSKVPDDANNTYDISTQSGTKPTIPTASTERNNIQNQHDVHKPSPQNNTKIPQSESNRNFSTLLSPHQANEPSKTPYSAAASVASTAAATASSSPHKPIRMHERERGLSFGVDNDYSESLLDEKEQQLMKDVVRDPRPRQICHTSSSHDDYSNMSSLELGYSASGSFDRERDVGAHPKKSSLVADGGDGGGSNYHSDRFEDRGINNGNGKRSDHNRRFRYSNGWGGRRKRRAKNGRYILPGTEVEERVMGECSFFYDEQDEYLQDDERMTQMVRPHHVADGYEKHEYGDGGDGSGHGYGDDGSDYGNYNDIGDGEGPGRYNQHNRRVNPRAVAHAISSTAKRQWKERRYRRRLRQSSHGMMVSSSQWGYSGTNHASNAHSHHHYPNPSRDSCELTPEHRQIFLAAHTALNGKQSNEYRARGRDMKEEYGYDVDFPDMDLNLEPEEVDDEEIRADLTHSSLAIRGGQIRLPTDNVRLVMDPLLEPGILSVETRALVGSCGNLPSLGGGNRYGYCDGGSVNGVGPETSANVAAEKDVAGNGRKGNRPRANTVDSSAEHPWRRSELSYVLTVDEQLYQRVVREMGDSYRLPCGVYYCCHEVEGEGGHDHVGIGVAVILLMIIFTFLVVCMFIWPMD